MNFSKANAEKLINAKNSVDDPNFVNHQNAVIYGTGTAQRVYLLVKRFFDTAKPGTRLKPEDLLQMVNTPNIIKENYPEVSNYWLQKKGSYINNTAMGGNSDKEQFWNSFNSAYRAKLMQKVGQMKKRGKIVENENELQDPRHVRNANEKEGKGPRWINSTGAYDHHDINKLIDDIIVRRSCKFLIYESIKNRKDIAYALDDLDLETMAKRQNVKEDMNSSGLQKTKLPICTSEIREIFRRWDYLQKHITFYKNFEVADPPWYDQKCRDDWALYAKHLAKKLVDIRPDRSKEAGDVEQDVKSGVPLMAIQKYHSMKPSECLPSIFINSTSRAPE